MRFTRLERILVSAVIFLTCVVFVTIAGDSLAKGKKEDRYSNLKIFTDVLAVVEKEYVTEVDLSLLVEGAIKGMLTSLDPHSSYLTSEFYQDLQIQTKGEFGGLGLEVTLKDNLLTVVSPMEGGPAQKAGILPGDVIVKIDGKLTKDYSMVDAVKNLRGPKGTSVTVGFYRKANKSSFEVTLTRDIIQVKSVRARKLEDGFGYLRISQFVETTGDDIYANLRKFERDFSDKKIKGLILDLRNNPGGLLNQAIRVADLFIEEGIIVYTDGRMESQKQKFFAQKRGTEPKYSMVVLINSGSASASEIVAGALKEDGRAVLVGNRTFGKGSVQTVTRLENGAGLSLTTALYYLKNGESIQLKGVYPDIEIDNPIINPLSLAVENSKPNYLREDSLPGAISNPQNLELDNSESATKPQNNSKSLPNSGQVQDDDELFSQFIINYEKEPLESWLKKDPQMQKAYQVLKEL